MAKETRSESLVRIANLQYENNEYKARIKKNDPAMRFTKQGLIFAASRGLDYDGSVRGRHVEFEVKETGREALPVDDIRDSQLDQMEALHRTGAETFLLVLFTAVEEWYRLEFEALQQVFTLKMRSIPREYFQAFGHVVPAHDGWPRYLEPESHPQSNFLRSHFIKPTPKERRHPTQIIIPKNYLEPEQRKKRILAAMQRGVKNAEKKFQAVQVFKERAREKKREEHE